MLSIRIVAAGAMLALTIGSATAQTATSSQPGKPLPLLQVAEQPNKATARPHAKSTAKVAKRGAARTRLAKRSFAKVHRAFAARRSRPAPIETETAAPAASTWPAAEPPAPLDTAAAPPAQLAEAAPNEMVGAGQMVQVAAPDDVNALDLAAAVQDAGANKAAPTNNGHQRAMLVTPSAQTPSEVGSAAWIAQVLAALGGAIAAGWLAWLLISPAPQRTYG